LRAYCRFSSATGDQVVSGALKFLFQSDAEFAPWYETHKNDSQPRRVRTRIMLTDVSQWEAAARAHSEFFARNPACHLLHRSEGFHQSRMVS
jgi:hypothetical protein